MAKLQWCPNIADINEATTILTAKFRTLKHEQAYVQLEDKRMARIQGKSHGIIMSRATRLMLKNAKMIHNHPIGKTQLEKAIKGLSGMDVGFAAATNMKSIAVLDEDIGVRITRPKKGWAKPPLTFVKIQNSTLWGLFGDIEVWNLE